MPQDDFAALVTRWGLDAVRDKYPDLRLAPVSNGAPRIAGLLRFSADAAGYECIDDEYEIDISIPSTFPADLPAVREIGGRIAVSYGHRNRDGTLCLGSPTSLRLRISERSPLLTFLDRCIIPTLYGYSYFERHGVLPFGELKHGADGLCEDLASLFGVKGEETAVDFVRLTSLRKRIANKKPCACRSGKRLGRCHHRRVNRLREKLQRRWFRRMLSR